MLISYEEGCRLKLLPKTRAIEKKDFNKNFFSNNSDAQNYSPFQESIQLTNKTCWDHIPYYYSYS